MGLVLEDSLLAAGCKDLEGCPNRLSKAPENLVLVHLSPVSRCYPTRAILSLT